MSSTVSRATRTHQRPYPWPRGLSSQEGSSGASLHWARVLNPSRTGNAVSYRRGRSVPVFRLVGDRVGCGSNTASWPRSSGLQFGRHGKKSPEGQLARQIRLWPGVPPVVAQRNHEEEAEKKGRSEQGEGALLRKQQNDPGEVCMSHILCVLKDGAVAAPSGE